MALHPAYRFSGIGRAVDPAYPTNRAILVVFAVALVVGAYLGLRSGSSALAAALSGANAALSAFLAWALTRELSPDDSGSAFVAAALAWLAWALVGHQSLLAAVVVLISVRLVNRSTGKAALASDTLLLVPLFVFAGWTESWTLSAVGAAAFALDGVLLAAPGQAERTGHRGVAALLFGFAAFLVATGRAGFGIPDWPEVLVPIVMALLALATALAYPTPRSCGDVDGHPLVHLRVRAGLLLGVAAAVLLTLAGGVEPARLGVLWSGLAATVAGFPFVLGRRPGG